MKGKQLTRQGKKLQRLPDGAPRRLADGRNAWKMMSDAQRVQFVEFMVVGDDRGIANNMWRMEKVCEHLGLSEAWEAAAE